ncbi:MAG: effector binding domain-containing protein [Candidatus Heimdallarchaeaceae archaeon]|jgi:DNA-binding transcriptional ArsR family regulator
MSEMPFHSKEALMLFVIGSLKEMTELHKALDHPTRLEILARLLETSKGFKEMMEEMDIQKTTLANHLNILLDLGLIEKQERGCYNITFDGEDILRASAKVYLDIKIRDQERLESQRMYYEALIQKYTILGREKEMEKESEFRIVKLPEMRVVSFHAMGEFLGDPETKAGDKMRAWVKSIGLPNDYEKHKTYGFNNPNPKYDTDTKDFIVNKENPYGYEFWITIDEDFEVEEDLEVKVIPEGLYVVKKCIGVQELGKAWGDLIQWVKDSDKYTFGKQQCLEHVTDQSIIDELELPFELYISIEE